MSGNPLLDALAEKVAALGRALTSDEFQQVLDSVDNVHPNISKPCGAGT